MSGLRFQDRSIVQRFNPLGKIDLPIQYLARTEALMVEDEWYWTEHRAKAWIFETHLEAEAEAKKRLFIDAQGEEHEALAIVIGNPLQEEERRRREDARVDFAEKSARDLELLKQADCYRQTARRIGEHDE